MDDETRQVLQAVAGEEAGLPPAMHSRITGESISEMRADAAQLAEQLGIKGDNAPNGEPAGAGDMNQAIRAAAGRST